MLELINAEREKAGVEPVILGDNIAAQLHAESSLENCVLSHWGVDGLKPYMRYSLAGGYQSNGENGLGFKSCVYANVQDIQDEIQNGMTSWMESSGHRRNILDKFHKRVNIGVAWNNHRYIFVQHFEGDYVEYETLPTIENSILLFAGKTRNDAVYNKRTAIQVFYDQPPTIPTKNQLANTYCYDNGRLIAGIRSPIGSNQRYTTDTFYPSVTHCWEPSDFDKDEAPRLIPLPNTVSTYGASWITALEETVKESNFTVRANLESILQEYGEGIYSIMVWGKIGVEDVVISEYSIFHGITPPDTYNPAVAQGEE